LHSIKEAENIGLVADAVTVTNNAIIHCVLEKSATIFLSIIRRLPFLARIFSDFYRDKQEQITITQNVQQMLYMVIYLSLRDNEVMSMSQVK